MTIRESVPLKELTTFKVGGNARYVIDCASEDDVKKAIAFARERRLPWYVLGGGSNVLPNDAGYEGVIVRPLIDSVTFKDDGDSTLVTVGAGVAWDALVDSAVTRGLWGIENLAGIPGLAGGAPVQNIGAYGAELAEVLEWVDALDAERGEVERFANEACAFAYRTSVFKRRPGLVILALALRLRKSGAPKIGYADLAKAKEAGAALATPADIAQAVRVIRGRKFPDLKEYGTAGSFFKNPIIAPNAYERLKARYPELPGFPIEAGVKIPLAWILDRVLNLRGFRLDRARLFEAQPLVIVAEAGATAEDIDRIAREVAEKVKAATGIELEREVRALS